MKIKNEVVDYNTGGYKDKDLYIYDDGTTNWCFSGEDIDYIKTSGINPLNNEMINTETIEDIKLMY